MASSRGEAVIITGPSAETKKKLDQIIQVRWPGLRDEGMG
jgi:hypothetical protein